MNESYVRGLKCLSAESPFATVGVADSGEYYTKLMRLKGGGILRNFQVSRATAKS